MEYSEEVSEHQKRVAFGIMKYLRQQVTAGVLPENSVESLEVAIQCIGDVYKLDLDSAEHNSAYNSDKPLEEAFPVARTGENSAAAQQRQAETFKAQGNGHLKNGDLDAAYGCYSKAIELDPTNATYFCNRAAGLIKQQKLEEALSDCQHAVKLNPNYARAHARMGYVYSSQGEYVEAKKCFLEATQLEPGNQNYKENLATVEHQLKTKQQEGQQQQQASATGPSSGGSSAGAAAGGGAGGIPGLGGLNLGNIINNPTFMNMASSLMTQPGFQQMASRLMGGGGGEGMMPQVVQMAQDMQQNNPELFHNLQQQAQGLSQQQQQQGEGQGPNKP